MKQKLLTTALLILSAPLFAADLHVPQTVISGQPLKIENVPGETMYLFGPNVAEKRKVSAGDIEIPGDILRAAGRYTVVIGDRSASFFVTNGAVESIAFLARPSRVPAAAPGTVTGTAFLFDQNNNLVLQPAPVKFELAVAGDSTITRETMSTSGVASIKLDSGRKEGAAQFSASSGGVLVKRVVQQVAADPCNLRMHASRGAGGKVVVETAPVRDCSGNSVPDGTIVTFTSIDSQGRSTVDARIRRGIAKAEFPAAQNAMLSVAAGVVIGNEIRWAGGQ